MFAIEERGLAVESPEGAGSIEDVDTTLVTEIRKDMAAVGEEVSSPTHCGIRWLGITTRCGLAGLADSLRSTWVTIDCER
jgi:hypothetical protein